MNVSTVVRPAVAALGGSCVAAWLAATLPVAAVAARVPPATPSPSLPAADSVRQIGRVRAFVTRGQLEPYDVVNQRAIRESRFNDPVRCPTADLLTAEQIAAARQACADRIFNVDHSP